MTREGNVLSVTGDWTGLQFQADLFIYLCSTVLLSDSWILCSHFLCNNNTPFLTSYPKLPCFFVNGFAVSPRSGCSSGKNEVVPACLQVLKANLESPCHPPSPSLPSRNFHRPFPFFQSWSKKGSCESCVLPSVSLLYYGTWVINEGLSGKSAIPYLRPILCRPIKYFKAWESRSVNQQR